MAISPGWRRVIRTFIVVIAILALVVALVWLIQRRLIYLPMSQVAPPPEGVTEFSFRTEDGLDIPGWQVDTGGESIGTVVVFNGNAGNRSHRLPLARTLTEVGFDVVLFDYRGYGDAPGSPSELGLRRDARALGEYLGTLQGPVIYFGESLGAAVSVGLATERPPEALVLRSPFTSLTDIARVHYPTLPVGQLLRDRWEVAEPLRQLDVPVLVIAGDGDTIVPTSQSREVYEAAPAPKDLVVIDGANHNDPPLTGGPRIGEAVRRFWDEHR